MEKINCKFPLGKISIYKDLSEKAQKDDKLKKFVDNALVDYSQCRWGESNKNVRKTLDSIVECYVKNKPELFYHHTVSSDYKFDDSLTITIATHFFANETVILIK